MVPLSKMRCFILILFCSGILSSAGYAHNPILDKGKDKYKDPMKLTNKSSFCIECHKQETPGIFEEWVKSTHARADVGCADCHSSESEEADTFRHAEKHYIRTVVTPIVCGKCHKDIQRDYFTSGHAQALEVLKKMKEDDPRFPVVAQYKDDNFQQCTGCHGGEITLDDKHRPDPDSWPDSGAGRINPNTSHGNCSSCHLGHSFSVSAARQPETCLRCHDGQNYPEGDIYRNSAHGVVYATQADKENLDKPGFYFTGKDMVSPTCAFCHFNGSGYGQRTRHNGAWRLPRDLTHPEAPMAPKNADNLRNNMKAVCNQCHAETVIDRFFDNADARLAEYQKKTVQPKLAEYRQKLAEVKEGTARENLLKEYSGFLADSKRYRMNLYMGNIGRTQR